MADDRTPPGDPYFKPVNPYALARNEAVAAQLKRFYTTVTSAAGPLGVQILMDGRPSRTPARREVVLPNAASAALLVEEWSRQGEVIRPADMPLMRLVNTVIDGVTATMGAVRAEIVTFAGSDMLFYRAEGPAALVALESAAWDPVLAWSRESLNARFYLAEGIVHVAQPAVALAAVDRAIGDRIGVDAAAPFRLAALHVMTTLTGSTLLALAVLSRALTAEEAWSKAHVDEDFQISRWGEDVEAAERRARRWADLRAAAALIEALQDPASIVNPK